MNHPASSSATAAPYSSPLVFSLIHYSPALKIDNTRGLPAAWERVIGLAVQPGVELRGNVIYERAATPLSAAIESEPDIIFEAHSTWQRESHLWSASFVGCRQENTNPIYPNTKPQRCFSRLKWLDLKLKQSNKLTSIQQ